jgi:hypothetical protein
MVTITFDAKGGIVNPTSITDEVGEKINLPVPTRADYEFSGWIVKDLEFEDIKDMSEEELSEILLPINEDGRYTLISNIDVWALWLKQQELVVYTITFNSDGGNLIDSIQISEGENIILPNATKENAFFNGWYSDILGGERIGGALETVNSPNESTTWFARWTELRPEESNINFRGNGGEPDSQTEKGIVGTQIRANPEPEKEDRLFSFWSSNRMGTDNLGRFVKVLSTDRTVFARYVRDMDDLFFSEIDEDGNKTHISERFQTEGSADRFFKVFRNADAQHRKNSILYKILERKGISYARN